MQDIDFDELDKAVSSVLQKNNETPAATEPSSSVDTALAATDSTPTPATPVSTGSDDTTVAEATTSAPADTNSSAPAAAPTETSAPLAAKRRGKFMDVVHPSSDMNPSVSANTTPPVVAPEPAQDTSADAAPATAHTTIQPLSTASDLESDTSPASTPSEQTPEPAAEPTQASPNGDIVDPAALQTEVALAESEAVPGESEAQNSDDQPAASADSPDDSQADAESTQTPFLPDAQVEKRPLGAFGETPSSDETQPTPADTTDGPDVTATEGVDPSLAPPVVANAPTPRELQTDVVEVEKVTDETIDVAEAQLHPPQATPEPAPTEAPEEPQPVGGASVSSDTGVPTPTGEATPASADDGAHPLFDTTTYHQPIEGAKQDKKSLPTWLWWVGGLTVCLGLGGAVGYVLFMSGF